MNLTDWHQRYRQQSQWTESLRRYFFSRLTLNRASRVLEVGCGTGAVLSQLAAYTQSYRYGLDLNLPYLHLAHREDPISRYTGANALFLPYPDAVFDVVFCHYFLLWVQSPEKVLVEMKRVMRAGGAIIAFAEPDYGGRIDYPTTLAELGRLQAAALREQGAETEMGRQLSGLFHASGLREIETGVMGGQWQGTQSPGDLSSEWATLRADLAGTLSPDRLSQLQEIDSAAWQSGQRVLFVPTFYAFGRK